ncbi:hypothetical protein ABN110_24880, partial [Escherichia coli]|uniref:hypothetical protein n=1 Tax=Escherichia coli TaxID=562 RepID=UPI0032DA3F54
LLRYHYQEVMKQHNPVNSARSILLICKRKLTTVCSHQTKIGNLMRIPLYSITDWHRSPISDSHPFDQPGT